MHGSGPRLRLVARDDVLSKTPSTNRSHRARGVHAGARICVGYTRIRELLYPVCVALELSIPTKLSLYKSD